MDKSALLQPRMPEADVEIPGVGTVRVRGLSRAEVVKFQELDSAVRETKWFATGMVDPKLSEEEVDQWRESATFAELELVSEKIAALSGLLEDSAKAAYKSVPGEPES